MAVYKELVSQKKSLKESNPDWEVPEDAINDLIYRLSVLRGVVEEARGQFRDTLDAESLKKLNQAYSRLLDAQGIMEGIV